MTDRSLFFAVKPIIHYPREAQVGKTYLMTIDLQPEEGSQWQHEQEEYPIYCKVNSEFFSIKPVGESVVVLHRFGGSYGEMSFLLTATQENADGEINITLVNAWGVAIRTIKLPVNLIKIQQVSNDRPTISDLPIISDEQIYTSKNKLYVICIGGSGAKCLESLIHVAATGVLGDSKLEVLFVDPDESNGNVERTRNSLNIYQKCQELVNAGDRSIDAGWMSAQIKYHGLWSPFAETSQSRDLGSFFHYNALKSTDPALSSFFDVLYSADERNQNLDEGFRGRPAIGAAVMSQIDLRRLGEEPWSSLLQSIEADAMNGQNPRVLLCGSMFGGTGASGLPTIAQLINYRFNNIRQSIRLGCVFLLPYFSFTAPPDAENQEGLFASADGFLLKTEAALQYLADRGGDLFDTIYLLGNETTENANFSIGRSSQRNSPHFIELMAALAAKDFLFEDRMDSVMLLSRQKAGLVTWQDLPDWPNVKKLMGSTVRLSYFWLSEIVKELEQAARVPGFNLFTKQAPWLDRYYDRGNRGESTFKLDTPNQQEAINTISLWCRDHLRWVNELHQCGSDRIELFKTESFGNLNGNVRHDSLSDLIVDDIRDRRTKHQQDDLANIKNSLDNRSKKDINRGTAELVRSLYKQLSI
jgi:hypothetical protein